MPLKRCKDIGRKYVDKRMDDIEILDMIEERRLAKGNIQTYNHITKHTSLRAVKNI